MRSLKAVAVLAFPFLVARGVEVLSDNYVLLKIAGMASGTCDPALTSTCNPETAAATANEVSSEMVLVRGLAVVALYPVASWMGVVRGAMTNAPEDDRQQYQDLVLRFYQNGLRFAVGLSVLAILACLCTAPVLHALGQPDDVADLTQQFFYFYAAAIPPTLLFALNQMTAMAHKRLGWLVGMTVLNRAMLVSWMIPFNDAIPQTVGRAGVGYMVTSWLSAAILQLFMPALMGYNAGLRSLLCGSNTIMQLLGDQALLFKRTSTLARLPEGYQNYSYRFCFRARTRSCMNPILTRLVVTGLMVSLYALTELGQVSFLVSVVGSANDDESINQHNLAVSLPSLQWTSLIANLTFACGNGISTLVGEARTAGNLQQAANHVYAGFTLVVLLTVVCYVIANFISESVARLYLGDAFTDVSSAQALIMLGSAYMLPDALGNIAAGGLRGLKTSLGNAAVDAPAFYNMAGFFFLNVTLSYVLVDGFGINPAGAFWARALSLSVSRLAVLNFYRQYRNRDSSLTLSDTMWPLNLLYGLFMATCGKRLSAGAAAVEDCMIAAVVTGCAMLMHGIEQLRAGTCCVRTRNARVYSDDYGPRKGSMAAEAYDRDWSPVNAGKSNTGALVPAASPPPLPATAVGISSGGPGVAQGAGTTGMARPYHGTSRPSLGLMGAAGGGSRLVLSPLPHHVVGARGASVAPGMLESPGDSLTSSSGSWQGGTPEFSETNSPASVTSAGYPSGSRPGRGAS